MSKPKFKVTEREDIYPVCPHCDSELEEVYAKKRGFPLFSGVHVVYFCPHCHKVIGFANSRMA